MKAIKHFNILESPGDDTILPAAVGSFHSLAEFILKDYLEFHGLEYTREGKITFMEQILASQDECYTLQTCADPLSRAIVSQYKLTKEKAMLALSQKNLKYLTFIIKKTLLNSLKDVS